VWVLSFLSGLYYNAENFYVGFLSAKNKAYALASTLPFVQFLIMFYCSSFSRFWEVYVCYFILVCGLFLLYANAIFNLSTVAGIRYTWFFVEPFLFLGLIAADNTKFLTD
jgi:hypothetical protein